MQQYVKALPRNRKCLKCGSRNNFLDDWSLECFVCSMLKHAKVQEKAAAAAANDADNGDGKKRFSSRVVLTGNVPGWLTRTDASFHLESDPLLTATSLPRLLHRNAAAYGFSRPPMHRRWGAVPDSGRPSWHAARAFVAEHHDVNVPTALLAQALAEDDAVQAPRHNWRAPDALVDLDLSGDRLELIGRSGGSGSGGGGGGVPLLAVAGGRALDEVRVLCGATGALRGAAALRGGAVQQLAPLKRQRMDGGAALGPWHAFARYNCTATLVRAAPAEGGACAIDAAAAAAAGGAVAAEAAAAAAFAVTPVEKLVLDERIVHVAASPHARGMAALIDESGRLYEWREGRGARAVRPPPPRDGSAAAGQDGATQVAAAHRRRALQEMTCEFAAHPMQVWATADYRARRVDLRAKPAADVYLDPLPYFREPLALTFVVPRVRALLQSRACPHSLYVSTDEHVLQMDARYGRDPVLRWDAAAAGGGFCDRLRWVDGESGGGGGGGGGGGALPQGVLAYGRTTRAALFHYVAPHQPSGGAGWQMAVGLSLKAQADAASARPLTAALPAPDATRYVRHGGALFMRSGGGELQLVQATSMGDVFVQPIRVGELGGGGGGSGDSDSDGEARVPANKRRARALRLDASRIRSLDGPILAQRRRLHPDLPCGVTCEPAVPRAPAAAAAAAAAAVTSADAAAEQAAQLKSDDAETAVSGDWRAGADAAVAAAAAAAATGHAPAESFHEFVRDADLTKHRYLPLDNARMRRLLEMRLPPVRGRRRSRGRGGAGAAAAAATGCMAKVKEESGSGSQSGSELESESDSEPEPEPRRRAHSQSQVMTQVAAARASIVKHLEAAPATLAELAVWCKRALALTAPPPRDALLDLVRAWPEVLELNVPATAPLRPLGVITLAPESAAATAAAAAAPPRAAQAAAAMDACVVLCAAPDFASKIPAKAVAEPRPPEMDFEDIDEDDIAQLYEQWGQLGEEDPG